MKIKKSTIKKLIAESIRNIIKEASVNYDSKAKEFVATAFIEAFPGMESKLGKKGISIEKMGSELIGEFPKAKEAYNKTKEMLANDESEKDIESYLKSVQREIKDDKKVKEFFEKKAGSSKEIEESYFLNESEWDLERLGRGRKPMRKLQGSTFEDDASMAFQKYRKRYPGISVYDDEFFIDFLIKTGKVTNRDDMDLLRKKLEMVKNEKEAKRSKDLSSKKGVTGAGRMMFEKRKKQGK